MIFPLKYFMMVLLFIPYFVDVNSWQFNLKNTHVRKAAVIISLSGIFTSMHPETSLAKTELPELNKCFNAVRKELSPEGESLKRINDDIDKSNWDDLKLFTREYDAGFRGGVLKSAWKQLSNKKQDGIRISNSFTFDLIALNKAARTEDKEAAKEVAKLVRQDLVNFLELESK